MHMPRTREELEKAASEAETWLESLDPGATPAENPTDLRRIGLALRSLADDQREVDEAVAAARENGRSWSEIGLVLGISRQTTRERCGHHPIRTDCRTVTTGGGPGRAPSDRQAIRRRRRGPGVLRLASPCAGRHRPGRRVGEVAGAGRG